MESARLKRYKDKLSVLRKRSGEIEEWKDDFHGEERTKLACYKAFQEIAESAMDMLAMMLKDLNESPSDDYSNIDALEGKKLLQKDVAGTLRDANGLRNRVIRHYNGTKENLAYDSMLELLPKLLEFADGMEAWLRKQ